MSTNFSIDPDFETIEINDVVLLLENFNFFQYLNEKEITTCSLVSTQWREFIFILRPYENNIVRHSYGEEEYINTKYLVPEIYANCVHVKVRLSFFDRQSRHRGRRVRHVLRNSIFIEGRGVMYFDHTPLGLRVRTWKKLAYPELLKVKERAWIWIIQNLDIGYRWEDRHSVTSKEIRDMVKDDVMCYFILRFLKGKVTRTKEKGGYRYKKVKLRPFKFEFPNLGKKICLDRESKFK